MKLNLFLFDPPYAVTELIASSISIPVQDSADKEMQAMVGAQISLKPKLFLILGPAEAWAKCANFQP